MIQLSDEQSRRLCRRAFGPAVTVVAFSLLSGGTYNLVYRIELSNGSTVVLRAAPPASVTPYWDKVALMRREYSVQPYLASLGHLIPTLFYVDFTQQLIDRDYMFQEYCFIFLLASRLDEPAWQAPIAAFCQSYGALAPDSGAEKRITLYKAMHLSLVAAWSAWRGDGETAQRALAHVDAVTTELLKSA